MGANPITSQVKNNQGGLVATFEIHHGDNRDVLKTLADNSVDSVVTDPPYELGFMGKSWDASGVAYSVELWQEVLRVLKPGGHLLAFSGSRTYHRMVVAIEDAGFEIRDQIMWIYGSGFPKSLNISKALDKTENSEVWQNNDYGGGNSKCEICGKWMISGNPCQCPKANVEYKTAEAKQWQGWGTALKPAHEPVVVARKPLIGTVAANVLTYGTGGLNIDASRVGNEEMMKTGSNGIVKSENRSMSGPNYEREVVGTAIGRWPANVIHDGSDEVVELFPRAKGGAYPAKRGQAINSPFASGQETEGGFRAMGDDGSAARFFYCAKASKRDRNEGLDGFSAKQSVGGGGGIGDYLDDVNSASGKYGSEKAPQANHHPTVKPTELMRYLCRLVTPPNGIVLDPFMGSGSTGKAAIYEGFNFVGIEMTDEYIPIAKARIEFAVNEMAEKLL
jgi:site-specific DNA-methyltransferase (adenine-specific)